MCFFSNSTKIEEVASLKVVALGDENSLKNDFIKHLHECNSPFMPETLELDRVSFTAGSDPKYSITIYDLPCRQEFNNIRRLWYVHTDIFLICFNLNIFDSFLDAYNKWYKEVMEENPLNVIFLGIQDQAHLTDEKEDSVVYKEVKENLKKIKINGYYKVDIVQKKGISQLVEGICKAKKRDDLIENREERRGRVRRFFRKLCCLNP